MGFTDNCQTVIYHLTLTNLKDVESGCKAIKVMIIICYLIHEPQLTAIETNLL